MADPRDECMCQKVQVEGATFYKESEKQSRFQLQTITNSDLPRMPRRKRANREFSAWAEYFGEEKDVEFIEWKKRMVGEVLQQQFAQSEENATHEKGAENMNK